MLLGSKGWVLEGSRPVQVALIGRPAAVATVRCAFVQRRFIDKDNKTYESNSLPKIAIARNNREMHQTQRGFHGRGKNLPLV
jgi:hypothetical protein